jgi:hypothetical protein
MGNQVTTMQAFIKNLEPPNNERRRKARSQQIRHWRNLVGWLVLIGVVIAVKELPGFLASKSPPPAPESSTAIGTEKEAFIALVFGRVSTTRELAIPASSFEAQITALKQADYSSLRVEQINQWKRTDTATLPAKPVLLTFEEANRETMEIADKILATQGMTALVFVDVNQLDEGNIQLVSWHQLEQLVKSGRWEVGVSGCPYGDIQAFTSPALLAQKFAQQREVLESRLHIPVVAVDCPHALNSNYGDDATVWTQVLNEASLPVGFVAAPFGANYRNDPISSLRRIRISRTWDQADLLSQITSHTPRRVSFVDKFESDQPAMDWVVDNGEITIEDGNLRVINETGKQGALMTLSGTEKWRDADVEVQLKGQPEGQFWIFLRHGTNPSFVRVGIADGQVMFQVSNEIGMTSQLASHATPPGDITLRLRVVDFRATAYLNGQPLLARSIQIPPDADHGAFALAVWNDTGIVDSGKASVHLAQVNATPLFPKCALVASTTGEVAWTQLRQQSEELSMVSPGYFSWIDGKAKAYQARDSAMETFASYHHLKILPALFIDKDTPLSDTSALTEQALTWASDPAYHGLNVILESSTVGDDWRPFLNTLNDSMSKAGKTLTVTLLGSKEHMPLAENDGLLLVATHADLLLTAPRLFYPANAEAVAVNSPLVKGAAHEAEKIVGQGGIAVRQSSAKFPEDKASYTPPLIPAGATAISFGLSAKVGTLLTDDYAMVLAP